MNVNTLEQSATLEMSVRYRMLFITITCRDGRWVVVYYSNRDDSSPQDLKQGGLAVPWRPVLLQV